jgi:hypothetical protein
MSQSKNTSDSKQDSRVLAIQYFMKNSTDFNSARQELFKLGIKVSYNEDVVIFSTMHSAKNRVNNIYAQESNGLILERDTYKLLVVPPRSLRFNIDTAVSNVFLHQGMYHIYKAEDGTCFNLYYYNNQWVISTSKGYNMNNVFWETKTYQQHISECLDKIGLTWETFTNQLDKKSCYSFGFKNPNFQKFYEGKSVPIYKIWFIQYVNLDSEDKSYLWAFDKSPIKIINTQAIHSGPVHDLKELYKLASCSLDNFLNYYSENGVNGVNSANDIDPCYGFILRSVNFKSTEFHSDLFIESSLMKTIRKYWYDNSIIDACYNNNWNKEVYVTLNAYLNCSKYELFKSLFSQYNCLEELYGTFLNNIADDMVKLYHATNDNKLIIGNKVASDEPYKYKYYDQSVSLHKDFTNNIKYGLGYLSEEEKRNLFLDYIRHPDSLELLMPVANDIISHYLSNENKRVLESVVNISITESVVNISITESVVGAGTNSDPSNLGVSNAGNADSSVLE